MGFRTALTCLLSALAMASGPARAASPVPAGAAARSRPEGRSAPSGARAIQVPLPAGEKAGRSQGPHEPGDCGICHRRNAPEAPGPRDEAGRELCTSCHEELADVMARKFGHRPEVEGCNACHGPHDPRAGNVGRLPVQLPIDLCVSCHGRDGVSGGRGGFLTNFGKWLDQNRIWREPVQARDRPVRSSR